MKRPELGGPQPAGQTKRRIQVLHLKTLGGLWLERDDLSVVTDFLGRPLALPAVIAAEGPQGMSRESVLGILWPEVDEDRGRHNLSQVLYTIKRQLDAEPILTGAKGTTLRLDPAVIAVDLDSFRGAVAGRDWQTAAQLYRGPFLKGFYLEEAPGFERWVEEVRGRLSRDGERSLEARAEGAQKAGMAAEARDCWHRLTELDPLNSRSAYNYVLALAASGDRGGAVRHGLAHAARLKEELGSAPPTRLTELMERLQRGTFVSTRDDLTGPT